MAYVDQNNVVSAVRGTEVVSDATNVFALLMAQEYKQTKENNLINYATTHRHVRSQAFAIPGFTAHFSVLCMATGGPDIGSFLIELHNLLEHINIHLTLLSNEFDKDKLLLKLYLKDNNESFRQKLEAALNGLDHAIPLKIENQTNPGDYYKLVQFKFFLQKNGTEINLSDGGFVDWTQKLIPNKKHRLLISAAGLELIYKIKHGLL